MFNFLPSGLYRKLAYITVLAAFLLGLTISLYQIYVDYQSKDSNLHAEIESRVQIAIPSAEKAIYEFDEQLGNMVLEGLFAHPAILEASLIDDYGDVFKYVKKRDLAERPQWFAQTLAFPVKDLNYPLNIGSLDSTTSKAMLHLRIDPFLVVDDFIDRSLLIMLSGIFKNLLLSVLVLFLCYKLVTKPINSFTQRFKQIDPFMDSSARVYIDPEHSKTEIEQLSNMINRLLSKVERGILNIRDLNKELNSEIAERTRIENALSHIEQHTAGTSGIEYIQEISQFIVDSLYLRSAAVFLTDSVQLDRWVPLTANSLLPRKAWPRVNSELFPPHSIDTLSEFHILKAGSVSLYNQINPAHGLALVLRNTSGEPNGILLLTHTKELSENFYHKHKSLLQILCNRITSELEREKQQETIRALAHTDTMTQLANRYYFQQKLHTAVHRVDEEDSSLALIHIGLDQFKWVNDSFSHDTGDKLLVQVAKRLENVLNENDSLARIAGDEFAILMEFADTSQSTVAAERIKKSFELPYLINNHVISVTASMGITVYPSKSSNPEKILQDAENARILAKDESLTNYQYFSLEIDKHLERKKLVEKSLSRAISESALDVAFQPQFSLLTGKLTGFESLARWTDEHLGVVSPAEFIPIAEETGLIHEIGKVMLHKSCMQIKEWGLNAHSELKVSVNVSANQLRSPALMKDLVNTIEDMSIAASLLELEITETALIEDIDTTAKLLKRISQLGVSISIDDFGTGYSSLKYLKELPIDSLKIDQNFIKGVPDNFSDNNIVAATLALAQAMELSVVAEGVETLEQARFLRNQGCDIAQGYYYSKPIAAEEVLPFLADDFLINIQELEMRS